MKATPQIAAITPPAGATPAPPMSFGATTSAPVYKAMKAMNANMRP
jgi:hypothetical protein